MCFCYNFKKDVETHHFVVQLKQCKLTLFALESIHGHRRDYKLFSGNKNEPKRVLFA